MREIHLLYYSYIVKICNKKPYIVFYSKFGLEGKCARIKRIWERRYGQDRKRIHCIEIHTVCLIIFFLTFLELEYSFSPHPENIEKYYPLIEAKVNEAQYRKDVAPCLELPYEIKYFTARSTWNNRFDHLFSPRIKCLQSYAEQTLIPVQVKEAIQKNDPTLCFKLPAVIAHNPTQHVQNQDFSSLEPQNICIKSYAEQTLDVRACKLFGYDTDCYEMVALAKKDPTYCENYDYEGYKIICQVKVKKIVEPCIRLLEIQNDSSLAGFKSCILEANFGMDVRDTKVCSKIDGLKYGENWLEAQNYCFGKGTD